MEVEERERKAWTNQTLKETDDFSSHLFDPIFSL